MAELFKPKKRVSLKKIGTELANGVPVVFWDTCSLLNILKLFKRGTKENYKHIKDILDWISQDRVVSVTSAVVLQEFFQNYDNVEKDNKDEEKCVKNSFNRYLSYFDDPLVSDIRDRLESLFLYDDLLDVVKQIWRHTIVIEEDWNVQKEAHSRLMKRTPPASVKNEYKDCYIWITFIKMSQLLPEQTKKFFFTSNTKDYCDSNRKQIEQEAESAHSSIKCKIGELYGVLQALVGGIEPPQ